MKNNNIVVFLVLLLIFPFSVYSEEKCGISDLKLENIEINNKSNNTDDIRSAIAVDNKVNIDLKMYDVSDFIEYKITAKNNSKNKYYIDKELLKSSTDYVNYEISAIDNSEIIEPNEAKSFILKVIYYKEVSNEKLQNGLFNDNKSINLNFKVDEELSDFINPPTGFVMQIVIVFILGIISIIFVFNIEKKTNINFLIIFFGLSFLIPLVVSADTCNFNIQIDSNVIIDERDAIFETGSNVNLKMKKLAGDDISENSNNVDDNKIIEIKYSEIEPEATNKEENNLVSVAESEYPIYMWYDDGVINWWSEAYHPKLNEDASNMFRKLTVLTNIDGLSQIDISQTKNIDYLFLYDALMSDYNSISLWNISNVSSMCGSFAVNSSLIDLNFLKKWDTSNVINMRQLFMQSSSINSLEPLSKWDVSNVTSMRSMFAGLKELNTLKGLENWDTSNVTSMYGMFMGFEDIRIKIENIDALRNWDVSNVKEMQGMFQTNVLLNDLEPLSKWDVSNVVNMQNMFTNNYSLTSLDGLEGWKTSNLTNISKMFVNCIMLEDVSAISNWDVSNVNTMEKMFYIDPSEIESEKKYSELPSLDISKWNMINVNNYNYFLCGLEYISSEFTIRNNTENYVNMLKNVATKGGTVTINYTNDTESLVDSMIATKSDNANIIKGRLVD